MEYWFDIYLKEMNFEKNELLNVMSLCCFSKYLEPALFHHFSTLLTLLSLLSPKTNSLPAWKELTNLSIFVFSTACFPRARSEMLGKHRAKVDMEFPRRYSGDCLTSITCSPFTTPLTMIYIVEKFVVPSHRELFVLSGWAQSNKKMFTPLSLKEYKFICSDFLQGWKAMHA